MPKYGQYTAGASGASLASMKQLNTGALVAGDNTITTGAVMTTMTFQLQDATNLYLVNGIRADPANPTTKIIINVVEDIPAGLTLTVIGTA